MSWLYSLLLASSILNFEPTVATRENPGSRTGGDPVTVAGDETERFEQTYKLSPNGRVSVSNINGSITIETWDNNEVKLEVVKTADTKERLNDAVVRIDSKADSLRIETDYENSNRRVWNRSMKLVVDYRLTVPRSAILDGIETINGSVSITNATNVSRAKTVNGTVRGVNMRGTVDFSAVNGIVSADFDELSSKDRISLNTVNGQASLSLPSDINATVKADSLNGAITNDFGLPVRKGQYVGRDLYGKIGTGEATIKLNSVNGPLSIKRKSDGRTLNPVVDLLPTKAESDEPDEPDSVARMNLELASVNKESAKAFEEARKEMELAQAEFEKARPEMERAIADGMRASKEVLEKTEGLVRVENLARFRAEADRVRREMRAGFRNRRFMNSSPVIDSKTDSFEVKGMPTVTIKGGSAEVSVRGWDRKSVQYKVTRISATRVPKPLDVDVERTEDEVRISLGDDCRDCPEFEIQIEVMVPKKSNLRINSAGAIRLENVSGDIQVEGGDESVNIRDVDGKLVVSSADGRVRVIGFRGDAEARTEGGEIALEGDLTSLTAASEDGTVTVTLPGSAGATIRSNTRAVEATGFPFVFESGGNDEFTFKLGNGGPNFNFISDDGRLVIRNSTILQTPN